MTDTRMRLEDWLDDLCVRFIINLPEEDLSSVARICFQVEEAQWFYEDFIRPLDPSLPSMSLRNFCLRIFQHCPLLSAFSRDNHMQAFEEFLLYKTRVPVRGAILLNEAMDSVVLVKGWKKGANWSFPRGKINKDEDDLDCAIREVYEETGFDIRAAGLVPEDEDVKYIEITMREQHMRLYVFRNIPMQTHFEPRTRKEISKIQWYRLSDLPAFRKKGQHPGPEGDEMAVSANKFYMVAPFLVPLKKWVSQQKKKDTIRAASNQYLAPHVVEDTHTEEEQPFVSATIPFNSVSGINRAPGIDTMEGATAALHRLLKIQPPTQGLQAEVVNATSTSTQKNSGEALLALLQGKKPGNNQGAAQPLPPPQTPLDLTVLNAPMPKTPHHHQPRPPHFSALPPPPNFAFPPQNASTQSHQYQSHMFQQPNNMIPAQHQGPPNPVTRDDGHVTHHFQPQQLQHPQPLPPQVQMGVFTSGQVHVPMVPRSVIEQPLPQAPQGLPSNAAQPQFASAHGPIISPVAKQNSTQLTSHSLALLNAFKSRDQATGNGDHLSDLPLRRFAEEPIAPLARPQELPAVRIEPSEKQSVQIPVASQQGTSTKPAPNDEHRSALLNLFKSPSIKAASIDSGSRDIGLGSKPTTSVSISQNESPIPLEASFVTPSPNGISVATKDLNTSTGVPIKDTNSTSSFRPTAILTRPPQQIPLQSKISQPSIPAGHGGGMVPQRSNVDSTGFVENMPELAQQNHVPNSQSKTFQPQILRRPTQGAAQMPAELAAPGPAGPGRLDRGAQSQEHKQTLLSLFGKGPSATLTSPFDQTKFPQTPDRPTVGIPPRSRVGSLASAAGERRGSQTPISPADKGFLLGYLDAVTKSGGQ